jgi:hypothetical protein
MLINFRHKSAVAELDTLNECYEQFYLYFSAHVSCQEQFHIIRVTYIVTGRRFTMLQYFMSSLYDKLRSLILCLC